MATIKYPIANTNTKDQLISELKSSLGNTLACLHWSHEHKQLYLIANIQSLSISFKGEIQNSSLNCKLSLPKVCGEITLLDKNETIYFKNGDILSPGASYQIIKNSEYLWLNNVDLYDSCFRNGIKFDLHCD